MPEYNALVVEVQEVSFRYSVEANSEDEARRKMEIGEVSDKMKMKSAVKVVGRIIVSDSMKCHR